ncbi:MAG TPA: (2Fe-2S)-binding protein [Steroidobacter sp.]|uniref:(2Fe-2S)-binding protein n=1 Tax=Steroidobacter sp. TaxID=1978227 RepID=UPI002ED7D542
MPIEFTLNRQPVTAADDKADMPLLWFVREDLRLKGTKFGCGIGQCGACTVLANGNAVRSCVMRLADAKGMSITTIEGLASDERRLHPVQEAWIEIDVPQCGYCQSGQILSAVALLARTPNPTDADIDAAMTNICRCGTYLRIRKAVKAAALLNRTSKL